MTYYSYLIKGGSGIFYFRITIPLAYRKYFNGKGQIRKSLKTRSRREALQMAHQLASQYRDQFEIVVSKGQISPENKVILQPIVPLNHETNLNQRSSKAHKLSDCISTFLANLRLRHKAKAEFLIKEKKPIFDRLLDIIGDKDIQEITFLDASKFFETIQQLPINMRKYFPENESIEEILKSPKTKKLTKLSSRTVNKYLENITTFFRFYVQNGVLYRNVFENKNLRVVEAGRACDRRQRFSQEDLKAIFENSKYFTGRVSSPAFKISYYWATLLALYTGARVSEICQLHLADILEIDGIWCISIAETTDVDVTDPNYKQLKNKSSCRLIPVHNQLIKLGFIDLVLKAKKKKQVRLFHDIKKRMKGVYGGVVGGWFNKNKQRYFGLSNSRQSFHSFRHTFIDTLKQSGVPEELVAIVVGHARKGITFNVYGKDYGIAYVKEQVVDRLDYNLKH